MSTVTRMATYAVRLMRPLLRDAQLAFWNFVFFPGLLLLFLGFLSNGEAAIRMALVPAIVSTSIMANMLFAIGVGLASARERGVFVTYCAAGATAAEVVIAAALARMGLVLAAVLLQLALAWALFGLFPHGNPLGWIPILLLGAVAFATVAFAIAVTAGSSRGANRLANIVLLPLMALGGIAVPASMLPESLWAVRRLLPIAPLQDGISGAFLGEPFAPQLPRLALLLVWSVVAVAAARVALQRRPLP